MTWKNPLLSYNDLKKPPCLTAMTWKNPRLNVSSAPQDAGRPETHIMSKKVYVSGIRDTLDEEDLRDYFSQYGSVESVTIVKDKLTGERRGFAFVGFEDYDPVDKLVRESDLHIFLLFWS